MKRLLICAAFASLFVTNVNAREILPPDGSQSPIAGTVIEHRAAKYTRDGVLCASSLITTTRLNGLRSTRESVDCEE